MKYFLFTALLMSPILSASVSHVRANDGQVAYNECMHYIFVEEPTGLWKKFPQMPYQKQAKYCIDFLSKKHPNLLQGVDLDDFTKGFSDGRFKHE